MNKEEIHKALEIIRQPITVNCKDYHYFDNENYDKLIRVYENCLWFINNFEQINETVEIVQKRNEKINHNWNVLKKWLEDEIIECKAVINTILPEFEKIMPRSSGKTLLTNEYNKQQTIIKSFEVMLCKMQELERGEE